MQPTPRRLVAAVAATVLALPLWAQSVPTTLNYQGRLLQNTADQDAVAGAVDIVFSIWSGPASDPAAVELWSEAWNGVGLSNGIFSVLLGSNGSPLDPTDFQGDASLYLQLEIGGETLLPRQQLGSAPFAMVDEPANELQDLELSGDTLGLTDSSATVDLSGYLDNTDEQDLSLSGDILSLTGDGTPVSLSDYRDNTDQQTLSLTGSTLSISGSGSSVNLSGVNTDSQTLALSGTNLSISGGNTVSLSGFTNTDSQTLALSGAILSISGGNTVSLAGFLDNTDSQNLASVLSIGNNAGNRDISGVRTLTATGLDCPDCVQTEDIDQDEIGGNDITDNIYILHIDCNGSCASMSMREACDVIENLRGLSTNAELIGVSCIHGIPSTSGNGFVPCDDGTQVFGDYECRAFNLRTLGDLPCINGDGTDVIVTCLETDIPK